MTVDGHSGQLDILSFAEDQQVNNMPLPGKCPGQKFDRDGRSPVLIKRLGGEKENIQDYWDLELGVWGYLITTNNNGRTQQRG